MEQYAKYLRKSRFDRDYAELSIEETLKRHESILDKLASDRGYYIARTYYEVVSGESIAARPEIQKLLEEVSAGLYAGILVVDLERLARGNGADQAYISQIFQFSGTKIITPSKTYDPNNEYDEEYFEFGLFMSRREYKTINRRLIRGRDSSAAEGKYISSIAPYGYRRVKIPNEKGYTLEPNPEESPIVKQIFELYSHGAGTKMIANALNEKGTPTRHGDAWTYSTIANILSNPVYTGKIRRGWSKQVKSMENGVVKKRIKRAKNPEEYALYQGLHPPLVSEELYLLVQQIRGEKTPAARVKNEFVLQNAFAGLLFCSVCGKRIGRTTMSAKRNRQARLRCVNMRSCHNASADYAIVERDILSALRSWLDGYKVKIDTVGFTDDIAAYKAQLKKTEQEAVGIEAQLEQAFNLVEQGVYTVELFKSRQQKLADALDEVKVRQEQLLHTIQKLEESEASRNLLIPHTEKLLASYEDMNNGERNALLKTILHKIEYYKGEDGNIIIDLYPRLPRL